MKSCLNHVGFTAGCKRCEALKPAVVQVQPEVKVPVPELEEDPETLQE